MQFEERTSASRAIFAPGFPTYAAAREGLRNYWYPVALSKDITRKPVPISLLGEKIALFRDAKRGGVAALRNRCPHRGIPLSEGTHVFPGTITCVYHGWTYDLADGELVAALTDGPDSAICRKASVRVQTYPAEERAGLVWVFVGEMTPVPPVEDDIPAELLREDAVIRGRVVKRSGNWRYGIENAVDEGHSKMLHRDSVWMFFREVPGWVKSVKMEPLPDEPQWLARLRGQAVYRDHYPNLGDWPRKRRPWESRRWGGKSLAVRLPGISRVEHGGFTDYQWFVPTTADEYLLVMLAADWGGRVHRRLFPLRYWLRIRPLYQHLFLDEDDWMIRLMEIPPERLYRPDASVTQWRSFVSNRARAQRIGDSDDADAAR
jgi:phenylpropionate dioxygenase-like ring-hydroxylating dioxygenase large terminal subunit